MWIISMSVDRSKLQEPSSHGDIQLGPDGLAPVALNMYPDHCVLNVSSVTILYVSTRYTGTQVCNDPQRQVITILLTNRCYKNDTPESGIQIAEARRQFNTAVTEAIGKWDYGPP